MGKYSRLGRNIILVFIGNAGAKLIGLCLLPFYTRWLSVEDYGTTDIINVYVTFLIGIVSCCITESIFIFPKGCSKEEQRKYFSSGLVFSIIMLLIASLVFGVIICVAGKYNIVNSFINNIWFVYGIMAATLFQTFFQQFSRSIDKMVIYSGTGIILTLCTALFSFILIPRYGVYGYVYAMIIAHSLTAVFCFLSIKGFSYVAIKSVSLKHVQTMLAYSIPLIPNGIMWWFVGALNRPLMEAYLGMHAIGIYAVANKFPGILSMMFAVFSTSWQISVLEEYGKESFNDFYNKIVKIVTVFLIALFIMVTMFSKLLVHIFSTPEFYNAWIYIPILTLATVFSNIGSLTGTVFSAAKQSKYFFYSSIWGAAVAVVFNFILIPVFGIYGAAFSVLFSFFAMAVSRTLYSRRYVQYTNVLKSILTILFSILVLLTVYVSNEAFRFTLIVALLVIFIFLNKKIVFEIFSAILKRK